MKKFTILLLICVCAAFGGCSEEENTICGRERIESLRESARNWRSGRYLLTNLDTGEMNQAFSFMYNEDGSQSYLYEVASDGGYYAEYSDGELMYLFDGESASVVREGGEGYVKYSESEPHPYSAGELLFYVSEFISSSSESVDEDGSETYLYYYNTDKINDTVGTSLTEFCTAYTFDSEGEFSCFIQKSSSPEGGSFYMISIIDVNSLTEIENPAAGG